MSYINYDTNGNITEQFGCKQYEGQLYTELDIDKCIVVDGEVVLNPNYEAEQEQKAETTLFTEARECIEKLLTYKLLYPAQAQTYQNAVDARYAQLDTDLAQLDGE